MANPYEPTADARRLAHICRDWYLALMQEGFTESQALNIIGVIIAAAIANPT